MKYLIVQDWPSTHGNHAGMKHMCDLLVERYPNEYELYIILKLTIEKETVSNFKVLSNE